MPTRLILVLLAPFLIAIVGLILVLVSAGAWDYFPLKYLTGC